MRRPLRWAALAAVAAFALAGIAHADDGAWLKARQARFAAFKRLHLREANEIA